MNWIVMIIAFYLILGLERGLSELMVVPIPGLGSVQPGLVMILVAFIALHAPKRLTCISAFSAGLMIDLLNHYGLGSHQAVLVIGPNALGCLLGAMAILKHRDILAPKHPLSLVFATLVAGVIAMLTALGLMALREGVVMLVSRFLADPHWYPSLVNMGWKHWVLQLIAVGITALIGLLMAFPLYKIMPLFGFIGEDR